MKKRKYVRCGNWIEDVTKELPENTWFTSINKAKKESFKIQMKTDGALGRGTVGIS